MKQLLFSFLYLLVGLVPVTHIQAQVAISPNGSPPDSSAMLDIQSPIKGLLIPRMPSVLRNAINNPAVGLLVFDIDSTHFFFYTGTEWQKISAQDDTSGTIFDLSNGVVVPGSAIDVTQDDFVFGSPQLDDDGDTTHDARFFFDKSRAAFRAGQANNIQWIEANIGTYSFASGFNTTASGSGSVAMGNTSTASSGASAAIGNGARAIGGNSIAMGYYPTASGNRSISLGTNTTAKSGNETVLGRYNTNYSPNSTSDWDIQDRLFSIGNGISQDSLSDAMVVLKSGEIGIGTSTPDTTLHVVGKIKYEDGAQAAGRVLTSDANGAATWQSLPIATLMADADDDTKIQVEENTDEDRIRFDIAGNEAVIIDSSGHVGIGTSTPLLNLHIQDDGLAAAILLDATSETGFTAMGFLNNGALTGEIGQNGPLYATNPNDMYILNYLDSDLHIYTDFRERMRITADGLVGIGSHTPLYPLHIASDSTVQMLIEPASNEIDQATTLVVKGARDCYNCDASSIVFQNFDIDFNNTRTFGKISGVIDDSAINNGTLAFYGHDGTNYNKAMYIDENGTVNVGTNGATSALEIVGSLKYQDGTQGNDKVLTSDNSGNASWKYLPDLYLLSDADGDTKIDVEESPDADQIVFTAGGTKVLTILSPDAGTPYLSFQSSNTLIGNAISDSLSGTFNSVYGFQAGQSLTSGIKNTLVGDNSGGSLKTGSSNTFIGSTAGQFNTTGTYNVAVGSGALRINETGNSNVGIGTAAGTLNTTGIQNVFLGRSAGGMNNGSGNIFIGYASGYNETGSDKLYIENSLADSSDALIYGEFDNDLLAINGTLRVNDGTQSDGHVLTSDTDGNASWQTLPTATLLSDTDNDTKIQVEESSDEDIIRFDIAGTEYFRFQEGRLKFINTNASMFIGNGAGGNSSLTNRNMYIGQSVGEYTTTGSLNTAIGAYALRSNSTGNENVALGDNALNNNSTGNENVALGSSALVTSSTGDYNVAIGSYAMYSNSSGFKNIAVGYQSLNYNETGVQNISIGSQSLWNLIDGSRNTVLGHDAGYNNLNGSGNVLIGAEAGYNELGSNKLYIENSNADSSSALVYGEFDNNLFAINGTLRVNDGTQGVNYVLTSDANGNATWQSPAVLSYFNSVVDADGDTKIQVEETSDEDVIHFDLGGTEYFRMENGRLKVLNADGSIYIGENAGAQDAFTHDNIYIGKYAGEVSDGGEFNIGIGSTALSSNTTGNNNISVGAGSLSSNTTGGSNIALGVDALYANTLGSDNTVLGNGAMFNNTIGNSNTVMGAYALDANTTGNENVAVGVSSLGKNTVGSRNTAIGESAGNNNISGEGNVFIGSRAGYNELGSNRLYIENSNANAANALIYGEFDNNLLAINGTLKVNDGTQANGYILTSDASGNASWQAAAGDDLGDHTASQTINLNGQWLSGDGDAEGISVDDDGFVGMGLSTPEDELHVKGAFGTRIRSQNAGGNFAGFVAENNNGEFFMGVQGSSDPNSGEFQIYDNVSFNRRFVIDADGEVGIGIDNPAYRLHVNGQVAGNGAYVNTSDQKYKTNIQNIPTALDKLLQLQGVSYDWKTAAYPEKHFDDRKQLGFIAQDVEAIVPEAVSITAEGDYGLSYSTFIPLLVEAVKELEAENAVLRAELERERTETAKRLERIERELGISQTQD